MFANKWFINALVKIFQKWCLTAKDTSIQTKNSLAFLSLFLKSNYGNDLELLLTAKTSFKAFQTAYLIAFYSSSFWEYFLAISSILDKPNDYCFLNSLNRIRIWNESLFDLNDIARLRRFLQVHSLPKWHVLHMEVSAVQSVYQENYIF